MMKNVYKIKIKLENIWIDLIKGIYAPYRLLLDDVSGLRRWMEVGATIHDVDKQHQILMCHRKRLHMVTQHPIAQVLNSTNGLHSTHWEAIDDTGNVWWSL